MDILFVVLGDETRASTRYRVFNLLPALDESAIDYECFSIGAFADSIPGPAFLGYGLAPLVILSRARHYDAIFLQKVPLPSPFLSVLKTQCETHIYDFDDAIYATPPWKERPGIWNRLLIQTLSHSQLAITGSPALSDYAAQFCERTVCLPTALPADDYERAREQRDRGDADTVTIGWIGNPENLHYLASIAEPLADVLDAHSEAQLLVITAGDLPVTPLEHRADVTYREWTLDSELDSLSEADIGIRPLFDDEWTRGKGGYTSVVQTMALGIPVVVTPVSMLADIVEDGVSGLHAETDEEWIDSLSTLIDDGSRRLAMGENALDRVDELDFWTASRAEEFVDLLQSIETKCH